jgi:hypothetical protein
LALFAPDLTTPYPLLLVLGDHQGVGKTTLVRLLSMLAGGVEPVLMNWKAVGSGARGAERQLVGGLKSGRRVIYFDNLKGKVESTYVSALVTTGEISCDALYRIGRESVRGCFLVAMTSNFGNVELDLCERACVVKLRKSQMKREWLQEDFSDWENQRKDIVEDVLYRLCRPLESRENGVSPIRFKRWWQFVCKQMGPTDPQCVHYRYRGIDFEISRVFNMYGETPTETVNWFSTCWSERMKYPELLMGVFDHEGMKRRMENLAGATFFVEGGAVVLVELPDGKYKLEKKDA